MAEVGTESDPDSKICRLTGFGTRFEFLVFGAGSGFEVSFSATAQH